MKNTISLFTLIFISFVSFSQGLIKSQYKSVLLLNDSSIYVNNDASIQKPIIYAGKEIGFHTFYNHSNILHATFIKKDDFYIYEEYDQLGNIIAKGKLIQNVLYCKKDSQMILSPITLKEIEKHITCYYSLVKIGAWEYHDLDHNKLTGNYFNGKKDGTWKNYLNNSYLSNIKWYKMDSLIRDSNVHSIHQFHKDSLNHMLGGMWYATIIGSDQQTALLERKTNDYSFDYSLKLSNDNLFERNKKFIVENNPFNSMKGQWKWNDDNTITLSTNNQLITLQFLYIDKNEIIIKEIHQSKI